LEKRGGEGGKGGSGRSVAKRSRPIQFTEFKRITIRPESYSQAYLKKCIR